MKIGLLLNASEISSSAIKTLADADVKSLQNKKLNMQKHIQ